MTVFKALCAATIVAGSMFSVANSASAKTLVYCSEASPEGFDPALYTGGTTNDAAAWTIYNRLVEFNPEKTGVIPGLAESWNISDDGLEYTFHLRKNVKFQTTSFFTPTRELNADDIIFTFDRARNPSNPWHNYMPGVSYQYFESMGLQGLIKDIVKVDDQTVKFVLNRPEAPFLANLAMAFISINSKEYADQLEKAGKQALFNQQPVGTGPFSFVAYQKDAIIRYKANADFYQGKPKIDNLVFAITTDPAVRTQKLKAGECHIIPYPAPADVKALKADPNLKVIERPGLNIAYMAYNTTQAPFDKVEVRQALNMAVNKKAIIDSIFDGGGLIAKNPIPPTMWGYNNNIEDDVYDPVKAKAMLEAAGVKDLQMKIWAMPVSRPYMPNARRTAELIQSDFAKVGVKAEIISMEWGEYLKAGKEKDRDGAIIMGWTGDNGDPDNFLGVLNSCTAIGTNNYASWCYQPFDDLISKAKIISDQADRAKLYEEAQVIFKQQAPWLTLDHSTVYMPMSKKVTGFVLYPVTGYRFGTVDIEE
ncbi:ABC transporter substrate-binding protein [Bartonella sp. LJL80]